MLGQMQDWPLLVHKIIDHAATYHGEREVVSRSVEGPIHRTNYREIATRSRKVAEVLHRLGIRPGDRVATLAWNGYRHLEIYYATSGSGLVCHTINPRLFPEQIAWIIADAADTVLCFDLSFLPLVEQLHERLHSVRHFVLMAGREHLPAHTIIPGLLSHDDLIAAQPEGFDWPDLDEDSACGLCYTSGTTGDPKGALYSHRSTVVHALSAALPDAMALSSRDTILPVVPMFHVNAWGLPYAAALVGARLVLPGPRLDGASLHELFEAEQVTFSAGVPTVWAGLLEHMRVNGLSFSSLKRMLVGGSACPPALMRSFEEQYGVEVIHGWGMTEMSPLGTLSRLKAKHLLLGADERHRLLEKQGRSIFGIDMEIVDAAGHPLPWNGVAAGDLVVRGPWVIDRYFGQEQSPLMSLPDGGRWFPTGDVATIDADGFMQITDRSKDVIKSGGEWISSIELENIAMAHPAVQEAAVVACRHERWDERPLLVVVRRPGAALSRDELLEFYAGRIAKWQVPDDVVFVDAIPHTATGKVQKLQLRERYRNHLMPE